jgi:tetraacyldisaccharide 4'-kinase
MIFRKLFDRIWYENHPASYLLLPFSWLYGLIVKLRKILYTSGFFETNYASVPVIVVGNITVGGAGKTPFVIWLSEYLTNKGYTPGVISRGYGRKSSSYVQQVRHDSDPENVGDEPVLIAKRSGVPVAVASDKYEAANQLVNMANCDVLICDDGLQHYALGRNLEIAIIDGDREFGNNCMLPAGPLREPVNRLTSVDMLISKSKEYENSFLMEYEFGDLVQLNDQDKLISINKLKGQQIHLVSGIANPDRFHSVFKEHQIHVIKHVFPDHYNYSLQDIDFNDDKPIVMTEKDAVKCAKFAKDNMWYLPVDVKFNDIFYHRIETLIAENINGQKIT